MQSNAPRVFSVGFQRALLYVAASAFMSLLPFLTDNTATFDVPRAVKAFAAAAITAFSVRIFEALYDATRAANGQVNRSDVGAFSPPIAPPPGTHAPSRDTAPFALQRPDPDEGYTQSYRPVRAPLGTPPTRPQDPQS